ncbi:hypothetical protein KY285_036508 [Solanum tuberosum]|nr:hypothetical protein KY284_036540 [Solanum tuberosum]KAH0639922.1 hypothetical protein KY285_036508 [Solanum tuberosum]
MSHTENEERDSWKKLENSTHFVVFKWLRLSIALTTMNFHDLRTPQVHCGFIIFSRKSLGNTFKVTLDGRIQAIQEESQQFPNPNEVVP